MEFVSGVSVKTRSANAQIMDPMLTIVGDGSRGTLNYYNWDDGDFDHVAIELGNKSIVNPSGGEKNGPANPGRMNIQGPFRTVPNNRQVNWKYLLFE